jgi:site-specific DNA-methyltransferase (adenine-specific)/modification methylase
VRNHELRTNQILSGDALVILPTLPDHSVDAVITDVPYNLRDHTSGLISFKTRGAMNKANVAAWNRGFDELAFLPEARRVLKPEGNLFIYCSHRQFGKYVDWLEQHFDKTFFGVWHKTNPVPQVRKVAFLSACELWVSAWNSQHKWNFTTQKKMHNFIESGICQGHERYGHEGQKPLKAVSKLVAVSTDEGDVVLDPFCGTGPTCVAAAAMGRRFIGIDVNPAYVQMARMRLCKVME